MVLTEIEEVLENNPINRNQHAFRKGSSCESALSDFTDEVERAIFNDQFAIGVFLDISGAFDNLLPEAAVMGMRSHGIPEFMINWYHNYLTNRFIKTSVNGIEDSRRLVKGTPQGGVLSPVIWNLAFDGLLNLYNSGPVHARGFADDAALLITGPDLYSMVPLIQRDVSKAIEWGKLNGLTFGAEKTVTVIFSRKKVPRNISKLNINGIPIEFSDSAKYLGVELDSKLTYRPHILSKIKKAKGLLFKMRAALGKLWGPRPGLIKWAFIGIIRSMVSYGCIIWSHMADKHWEALQRLQRLAMLMMGHFLRSTPTKGLEVILGLPPLHLHLRTVAAMAALRIRGRNRVRWDGLGSRNRLGHLRILINTEMPQSVP